MSLFAASTASRRGFTLIELMMVIVVIGILTSLMVVGGMYALSVAREGATRSTLTITNKIINDRLLVSQSLTADKSVDPVLILGTFFSSEISSIQSDSGLTPTQKTDLVTRIQEYSKGVTTRIGGTLAAGTPGGEEELRMKQILAILEYSRLVLPQTWEEADYQRCVKRLPKVATVNPQTESAEVLYFTLTQGNSAGLLSVDADAEAITPDRHRDTDGNGMDELIDGWGHPVRFYRWPTRLVGLSPAIAKNLMTLPDDPAKDAMNPMKLGTVAEFVPGMTPATLAYYRPDTFHFPLVVSAGADGLHGLRLPSDVSGGGFWGAVDVEANAFDDIGR